MHKNILYFLLLFIFTINFNCAQQCLSTGFCTNFTNQYPATTFTTSTNSWTTVSAYMNAGNWTLFQVSIGNTYEWSYCESYGGASAHWDAELTLLDNSGQNLCFSDNNCGVNGNAPYLSWTATYTGIVKLLTSEASCKSNTSSPYNTLVWRQANGGPNTAILGIDVSHHNGSVNWPQVYNAPKFFAWAKATEGPAYTDNTFSNNMNGGNSAGVIMGAYHFAHPFLNTAIDEANHFLSVAQPYIGNCALPPVLDLEDPTGGPTLISSMSSAILSAWVQDWINTVKTATGIDAIIYTNGSIASYLNNSLNKYKLWIASPDGSPVTQPTNIGIWTTWTFKQYSWSGSVSGISGQTDLNVFNGDINAFNALIGCSFNVKENIPLQNNFFLYPNPTENYINVETRLSNQAQTISIYNTKGQLIKEQTIQQKAEINMSGFDAGIYIIILQSENGMETKKFIKVDAQN